MTNLEIVLKAAESIGVLKNEPILPTDTIVMEQNKFITQPKLI